MLKRTPLQERAAAPTLVPSQSPILQRKCACGGLTNGGSCSACAGQEQLQRSAVRTEASPAGIPTVAQDVITSPGQPLDTGTRSHMEARFGFDFAGVRVHADSAAAASADALGANAYTVGSHIAFGPGKYRPDSTDGTRLLGHELTHVLQQRGVGTRASPDQHDRSELEADRMGAAAADANHFSRLGKPAEEHAPVLQRQSKDDAPQVSDEQSDEICDGDFPTSGGERVGERSAAQVSADEEASLVASELMTIQLDDKQPTPKKGKSKPPARKITQIDVDLSSQTLTITWSDGTTDKPVRISSGIGLPNTKDDPCKDPSLDGSNCTPTGTFKPGKKGDSKYKNDKGDAMSWYVELEGKGATGRGVGIHDSQPVTGAPASHGCVRIDDAAAKLINRNVTSSTDVAIKGKAPTRPWKKSKPPSKKTPKKK